MFQCGSGILLVSAAIWERKEGHKAKRRIMRRSKTVLPFFFLLVHCTNGFIPLLGNGGSFFPPSPIHCGKSELPPNKDYRSPLVDSSRDSFIDSLKKSVNSFREEATAGAEVDAPTTQDSTELPLSFEDAVSRAAKLCAQGIQRGGLNKLRIDFDTSVGDMTYTSLKNTLPMAKQLTIELGAYCFVLRVSTSYKFNTSPTSTASSLIDFILYHLDKLFELSLKSGADSARTTTKSSASPVPAPVSTEEIDPEEAAELAAEMAEMAEIAAAEGLPSPENTASDATGFSGESLGTMCVFFPDMGAAALARRDWKMG